MKKEKNAEIQKAENGYMVKVKEPQSNMKNNWSKAMMKLLENTGAFESWQQDKKREIEETLKDMPQPQLFGAASKTYIFRTFKEAVSFLYDYFGEIDLPSDLKQP